MWSQKQRAESEVWRYAVSFEAGKINEKMEPKQKQHPAVDVTGDGSKVRCDKKQYYIGTWNIRSMGK